MEIEAFYERETCTLTYIVWDKESKDALIIDPVLNYSPNSGQYSYQEAQKLLDFVNKNSLNVHYILETHVHADHLSSSVYLKEQLPGAKLGIGERIKEVQEIFTKIFNLEAQVKSDGSQFDHLFYDGEEVSAGSLKFKVLFTPGHTPACCSLLFDGVVFTGDALFMPDYGTGRCDFPRGDAEDLYDSVTNVLYKLPDETRVLVGHDYCPKGRELKWESTIGESKKENIRLKGDTARDEFVNARKSRDSELNAPRLLYPSLQVNMNAGKLPGKEDNGQRYLKQPLFFPEGS